MLVLANKNLLKQQCFIDGQWVAADKPKKITVKNPVNGKTIAHVPACETAETTRAIQAAHKAYLSFAKLTAEQRANHLRQWAELIERDKEDLARLMTLEGGKPIKEARAEVDYANRFIKWYAEEARRIYGDIMSSNQTHQHLLVVKQAIGVVAAITPWNFPAAMITRKLAPALAAGCTVVLKPAEDTPLTALALAALAEEAGMPPGVINVVTGQAKIIGACLTEHPLVRKLSFTGSTAVGKLLMKQCATTLKKVSFELGGNAPFIIFDDADIDDAVKGLIASKFRNAGQTCVCANRVYVQASIYDAFAEKLTAAVKKLKVSTGDDETTDIGPLINKAGLTKVKKHVADALKKQGKILLGGKGHALGGLFFEPTVIINANADMLIAQEETFGPVAALFKFDTEEEVIAAANATPYGLASYFYSKNLDRAWRVSEALEYGMVGINTGLLSNEVAPFGGMKESGIGREGSRYGIEPYVEIKYLCMQTE